MFQTAQGTGEQALTIEALLDRSAIRLLIRYATKRTGTPVRDDDLEQEAMVRVLRALRRTGYIEYPKAFAAKIVRDTVQDYWRQQLRRFDDLESIPERVLSHRPAVEVRIDHTRQCERLSRCLDQLSERTRAAIELFYVQEYSISDLASALHFSTSAAKMTLLRGRRELRKMMEAP